MITAKLMLVGSSTNFNISNVVGANNIGKYTEYDFICVPKLSSLSASCGSGNAFSNSSVTISATQISLTYDNTTGDVVVNNMEISFYYRHGGQSQSASWSVPTDTYMVVRT